MTSRSHHFQSIGQTYHDFEVTNLTDIPELSCCLIELTHRPTGARVMHIGNDDPENTFCLSFQTIPRTSNGVAHILEHTVLCGSKKFPVKDPFFAMQRRSLNTFMNALTGADFTCYPAASQVKKDFYNLLDVYLDAVFHPFLKELSFLQEGHRLEFVIPNDSSTPLEYKGIVFNEMKGAMASAGSRLSEALSHALFPDLTYGINSGGDPLEIPKLTYEELWEFYNTYYHPSRCLFFFYGNLPLEGHLDFITENVLKDVTPAPPLPKLPLQPRFTEPRHIVTSYPVSADDEDCSTQIAFGWLTCQILEQQELLALNILQIILLDNDASPLKMALLKSDLCKQVSSYMDDEISEVPFIISLKGCTPNDTEALEKVLRTSLSSIVLQGIPLEMVENAIHQLEFYRSEITGDHAPFGLSLFMRSALLKQHGGDPVDGLKIHSLFDAIRKKNLENPNFFSELIQKYLLDNPHFVSVTIVPDKTLAEKEMAQERANLEVIQEGLTQEMKDEIIRKAKELAIFQKNQEDEDPNILPKVTLDDVPRASRVFDLQQEKIGNLNSYHHTTFTNGIVYADLFFNLPKMEEKDLPYVRLFASLLSQMGCNGRNYAQNLEYIQAHTGGISSSIALNLQSTDFRDIHPTISIRGKALHRKTPHLFSIINETATSIHFDDKPRLKEVLNKQYTALQSQLTQSALRYSINLSAAGLDVPSKIANTWYGLEYYWLIKELAQNFDKHAETLVAKLKQLQTQLLCQGAADLVTTCDASTYDELKRHEFYNLQHLQMAEGSAWSNDYPLPPSRSQGRVIASPVAFSSKVIRTVPYIHPDAPALNIASFLMDNLSLHTLLREQGGAYGGGASSNPMSGNFYFYSYRDPNIASTLKAFEKAVEGVLKGEFDDSDIEESQLEMIQAIDTPVAPGSRGDYAYGWLREGKTLELRQAYRDKLLLIKKKDVIQAVENHIRPNLNHAAMVVFAGRDLLEKENVKLEAEGHPPLPIEVI